jgi:REP element-mobilizing transposase RayT
MPNTYSQIHIQIVLAVANREYAIRKSTREQIEKYITGIISSMGQKPLAISCMPDHTHIFFGLRPSCCISDLVREVKKASTKYINDNRLVMGRFAWQEGFGAFSYSRSEADNVIDYIKNQEEHHQKDSFQKEYMRILRKSDVDYDPRYLFSFWE